MDRYWNNKYIRNILRIAGLGFVLFLVFYNLTRFPVTWYDEGSHLHVPKTLIEYGKYADRSSEGFRYYGPTVGVGPTVMLPIAGVFYLFGIGLLQARMVMAIYLLITIFVFFQFSKLLGGERIAWIATLLLITSQGIALLEYGRQVLGEVPGMLFLLLALWIWFKEFEKPSLGRLVLVGVLAGLATVTKNQYLIVIAPTFAAGWFLNLVYYRAVKGRYFIVPAVTAAGMYVLWQVFLVLYLGPSTAAENFQSLRIATSGAALVFSPSLMKRSAGELLSLKVFFGWLIPILVYGISLCIPRRKEGMKWGILMILVGVNLVWYVVASVSWIRYAFPALAISSLFVARFFEDVTGGFIIDWKVFRQAVHGKTVELGIQTFRAVAVFWLLAMIAVPFLQNLFHIVLPPFNAPLLMARFIDENIPQDALVETWEPEMGFLTNHNYHFPPQILLDDAVGFIWRGGPPPSQKYDFTVPVPPDYVLVGQFSSWVQLYPFDVLEKRYTRINEIGAYVLYQLRK